MTTPRVVLDTNVLVSGLLGGAGRPVLERWRAGDCGLVISPEVYAEYKAVLSLDFALFQSNREQHSPALGVFRPFGVRA